MPTTHRRRGMIPDAIRSAIVAACALAALAVAACAPPAEPERAYACGTYDVPPIAVDEAQCRAAQPGARWYSGRADDLDEPDEQVVIGQPLDEDWYDPIAQADLDDVHTGAGHSPRVSTPTNPPTTTKARPAPRRSTPTTAPTTTRRR